MNAFNDIMITYKGQKKKKNTTLAQDETQRQLHFANLFYASKDNLYGKHISCTSRVYSILNQKHPLWKPKTKAKLLKKHFVVQGQVSIIIN
jgi:hypothetical protein